MNTNPILLLDNYDSFVHNLARYLRLLGESTQVIRSDQITIAEIESLRPNAIVISPGPKRPEQAGCCVDVIRELGERIPILGICLGHQAVGQAYGARIVRCDPVHGSTAVISHDGDGLFCGCEQPMTVGRYHSLAIDPGTVPDELIVTAKTEDGLIMAVQHRRHPVFGVQFHPESVLSPDGSQVLKNFLDRTRCAVPAA